MTRKSFVDESLLPNVKAWQDYYSAKVGFRNHWYAAGFSKEIPDGATMARTILGEDILFRRVAGVVYAIKDRCIHRGIKLSDQVECNTANTISCWWHGFTFRWQDGLLTNIIGAPESKMVGKRKIKTYPVEEAKGMIFVFVGDKTFPTPSLADDLPPSFLDEDRIMEGEVFLADANWRMGPEGGLDEIHRYLHRNSTLLLETRAAMPLGYRGAKMQCEIVENETGPVGIIDRFSSDTAYFDVGIEGIPSAVTGVRFADAGKKRTVATSCWLPGVIKVEGFPQEGGCFYEFYVPIDENQHMCYMLISEVCPTPESASAFRSGYQTRWKPHAIMNFLQQDMAARASAGQFYKNDRAWLEEMLVEEDFMLFEWRKLASRRNRGVQKPEHVM